MHLLLLLGLGEVLLLPLGLLFVHSSQLILVLTVTVTQLVGRVFLFSLYLIEVPFLELLHLVIVFLLSLLSIQILFRHHTVMLLFYLVNVA